MSNKSYVLLPKIVLNLLVLNEGWLVGSSVQWFLSNKLNKKSPRDYDIIIPPCNWNSATKLIDSKSLISLNRFGGLKIKDRDIIIDLWPCHIEEYFKSVGLTKNKQALRLKPFCHLIEKS